MVYRGLTGSRLVAAAALGLLAPASPRAAEDGRPPALPEPDAHAARPAPASSGAKLHTRSDTDPASVFRRSFWRQLAPEDRVVHAERREVVDDAGAVRAWTSFLVVRPGREFREWLFTADPFSLRSGAPSPLPESPPDWFPSADRLSRLSAYRSQTGSLQIYWDEIKGLLYVHDAGLGFAPPAK